MALRYGQDIQRKTATATTTYGDKNISTDGSNDLTLSPGGNLVVDATGGNINFTAATTETRDMKIGYGRSGNGYAAIGLIGDATYTSYGIQFRRDNSGENSNSNITHRGTGALKLNAYDAGSIALYTNSIQRMALDSSGNLVVDATITNTSGDLTINPDGDLVVTADTSVFTGTGNNNAVSGTVSGTGYGVKGVTSGSGYGLFGDASGGSGIGIYGKGGTGNFGAYITGGSGNGTGVYGAGIGTGTGVVGIGGSSAGSIGVRGTSTTGYGVQASGDATNPDYAALRIVPQNAAPLYPQEGDVYVNSTDHHFYGYNGSSWVQLDN